MLNTGRYSVLDPEDPNSGSALLSATAKPKNKRYAPIIEQIFFAHQKDNEFDFDFERQEIIAAAESLKIKIPKNVGDVVYSFRYRQEFPASVSAKARPGEQWIILPMGRARYRFTSIPEQLATVSPAALRSQIKIPDSTPGLVAQYALGDEQALLALLRYNRLIDILTGLTCYTIQNHLRTSIPDMGQVETDEIYVGVDQRGVHYLIPVQAKAGSDKISIVQIIQDLALSSSKDKWKHLICRPVAAQFMRDGGIALFLFTPTTDNQVGVAVALEKHYRVVPPNDMNPQDIVNYTQTLTEYEAISGQR